jgi:hypothetical protein
VQGRLAAGRSGSSTDRRSRQRGSGRADLWIIGLDEDGHRVTGASDVRAEGIAKAFGLQANQVGRYAGPGTRNAPCQRCGTEVTHTFPSRSAVRHGRRGRLEPTDWRLCPPCRKQLQDEEREERQRRQQKLQAQDHEIEELRRQAEREGRYRVGRYVEYEGVPGTWFLEDDEEPGGPRGRE